MTRAYSHRGENATVDLSVVPAGFMSAIAGISYERGKELIEIQNDAVDADDFSEYLIGLSERHSNRKLAIFIDNLSVHHTSDVKTLCEELGIRVIYNRPYSPDFNPIEFVFSNVKNHFKRARFNLEHNSKTYDMGALIEKAFSSVKLTAIRNSINYSMSLLGVPDVDTVFPKTVSEGAN